MHETAIDIIVAKNLHLEGVFTKPHTACRNFPAVVVCHPHPLLVGDMEHPLVTAICRVANREKIGSLRFNFRGVGKSNGIFSNGDQEWKDVEAALNITKLMPGTDVKRLALVGYSFGASTVLQGLPHYKETKCLVLISPSITSVRNSRIMEDKRPKMFIVGQSDGVVPSVDLQKFFDDTRHPDQFIEIAGANHNFLARQTKEVAEHVIRFLLENLETHNI